MDTRRKFILGAGTVAATSLSTKRALGANEKVRVGVIGVNGRGKDHIAGIMKLPDAEVVALCDVDTNVSEKRATEFQAKYGKPVDTIVDMRKLFERKDIDAVTVATPNHWHALATIWACQAGKDVYVEKPGCHNVFEGRKMIEAAHKYKRIVQHGVQLRSSEALREGVEKLRAGVIGDVYMSRGLVFRWRPSIGNKLPEPEPAGFNYDLWTGPAEKLPFSKRYVHYNWHWNWNFGNGDVGNQGIHETDMCMWGLGVDTLPNRITSIGGKFLFTDDKETPEVQTSIYHWPEKKKMIQFEVRHWYTNDEYGASVGNLFYGSEGVMVVKGYDTYEIYKKGEKTPSEKRTAGGDHFANWIKAVKSRRTEDQNGPVETAHLSSSLAHLGNISDRLDRQMTFDPVKEKFIGDKEGDAMLTRKYRKGFEVPDKV